MSLTLDPYSPAREEGSLVEPMWDPDVGAKAEPLRQASGWLVDTCLDIADVRSGAGVLGSNVYHTGRW